MSEKPETQEQANLAKREAVRPPVAIGETGGGLAPKSFDELLRVADVMAKSGLMPKGIDTPAAVFVAIQFGFEIGLSPMAAVQSIAVINGRPSLWGDAVLGLIYRSGQCAKWEEEAMRDSKGAFVGHRVTTRRRGDTHDHVVEFTLEMARRAKLAAKSGPWSDYPERMCRWRACSWAARDKFPDVLKGLHIREDVETYDVEAEEIKPYVEPRSKSASEAAADPVVQVMEQAEPVAPPAEPEPPAKHHVAGDLFKEEPGANG